MNVLKTELEGVVIIEPRVFPDARGYFFESWNREAFRTIGIDAEFVQDNESCSAKGVLRGLHFQRPPHAQAKLVRVIRGAVLDVAVDIRRGSPTYGKHVPVELTGENKRQMFIPRGYAHGFLTLEDGTVFAYKCDAAYAPSHEAGITPYDEDLGIDWRLPRSDHFVSEKDAGNRRLTEICADREGLCFPTC